MKRLPGMASGRLPQTRKQRKTAKNSEKQRKTAKRPFLAPRIAVKSQNLNFESLQTLPAYSIQPPTMTHTTHGITHHAKRSLETGKFGRHR